MRRSRCNPRPNACGRRAYGCVPSPARADRQGACPCAVGAGTAGHAAARRTGCAPPRGALMRSVPDGGSLRRNPKDKKRGDPKAAQLQGLPARAVQILHPVAPRLPGRALPDQAAPRHACRAMPRLAVTRLASPRLAVPASPSRAVPSPASTCRSMPASMRGLFGAPSLLDDRENIPQLDQLRVAIPPRLQFGPGLAKHLGAKIGIR